MEDSHPSTTTIPSDPITPPEPTPSTSSPAPKLQPPPPTPHTPSALAKLRLALLHRLTKTAHTTDRTLFRLSALLSTPSGTDVLLCTTSYTLTLLHALLSRLLARRLASLASEIASKVSDVLLPGETLVASLPAPTSTKLLAQTVGTCKALAATIADYRIFVRLWGCVGLYTWARSTYCDALPADAGTKEKVLRSLTWASIASCVGFQVLENGAYLSSKGALTGAAWAGDAGRARENRWWLWSSRFWAAYVGVEFARLGVSRYYRPARVHKGSAGDGEKEDKIKLQERREKEELDDWLWWKDVVSNIAYAPMTLHWSMEQGLLSDWGVGACGIVAGGALLTDAWRKTA